MSDDRDKLLQVMNNLEADYRSGKISAEKYRYFRSKYEDKLNSIDAIEATRRIRSMQGKSAPKTNNKRKNKRHAKNKRKQEQDLVQKYIIDPKKDDSRYNKKEKSSMSGGTFRLIAILVLVIAFTAGVAYGIFNLDTETIADTNVVATVEDTAFPEIVAVVNDTNTTDDFNDTNIEDTGDDDDDKDKEDNVETTTETTTTTTTTTDRPQGSSSSSGSSSNNGGGSSNTGGGSSSTGGGNTPPADTGGGGSSDSGGGGSAPSDGGGSAE